LAQKILLADDSVTAQNMGRRILSEAGYEVITVNNGSAALKKIAELKPDLIILDIYMPGYGGLEVCQRVKDDPETARIPVLLTVGKLEPFRADEARKVHADAHLVKPFEASELLTALAKLEDKIVPRAEPRPEPRHTGAPGKSSTAGQLNASTRGADFADKTSGWKSRLAIPGLSKRSEPETPAPAKTGFRDFQRVEGQGSAEAPAATPARTVQDITAEEMAAISAAAAALREKASLAESELAAGGEDSARSIAATPEAVGEAAVEVPSQPEAQPAVALEAAIVGDADQKSENESLADRTSAESQVQTAEAQAPVESVSDSEVVAALESLAPSTGERPFAEGFGVAEPAVQDRVEEPQEVPIAIAASVGTGGSRWIAEEVPLAEDDAAFILEREMQKVFAALAELNVEPESMANFRAEAPSFSADTDPFPAASAEPIASPAEPDSVAAFEESHPEAFAASSEPPLQVAAEAENNVASGSVELEPVVEAAVSSEPYASQERPPEISEPAAAAEVEVVAVAEPVFETQGIESQGIETQGIQIQDTETPGVEVLGKTGESEPEHEAEEPVTMAVASEPVAEPQPEAAYAAAAAASAVAAFRSIRPVEAISQSVPAPVDGGDAAAAEVPANGAPEREAELAAAWAQWRQIRDSIGSPSLASPAAEPALAAEPTSGFKDIQRPEPAQPASHTKSSEPADAASIASIVDSMLAELRPKLVEEIARKMGQEKK
jgi:CheY-like chemotaxis protein